MEITGVGYDEAAEYLAKAGGHVKTAIVMILAETDSETAKNMIDKAGGFIRKAVKF
jgi:N-acetylmuramic acid 6-phosphate etherase